MWAGEPHRVACFPRRTCDTNSPFADDPAPSTLRDPRLPLGIWSHVQNLY